MNSYIHFFLEFQISESEFRFLDFSTAEFKKKSNRNLWNQKRNRNQKLEFPTKLPYTTKDGNYTSLLVAAGPDVAVNLILGLPFIKATDMIADFVDNVCEAKNLLCNPFLIDFKRATKSIPVFTDSAAVSQSHSTQERSVLQVLNMLRSLYRRKPINQDPPSFMQWDAPSDTMVSFTDSRVPPVTLADTSSNYHDQVLGDLGYL